MKHPALLCVVRTAKGKCEIRLPPDDDDGENEIQSELLLAYARRSIGAECEDSTTKGRERRGGKIVEVISVAAFSANWRKNGTNLICGAFFPPPITGDKSLLLGRSHTRGCENGTFLAELP